MSLFYTDEQIQAMIGEPKPITQEQYAELYRLPKTKKQHKEQNIELQRSADADTYFLIILRLNKINPLDFSAILAIGFYSNNNIFKLRRYNGKSHRHQNKIEGNLMYNFHIHTATERYQLDGYPKEESYAEITNRYNDIHSALRCMIEDCNIILPNGAQLELT